MTLFFVSVYVSDCCNFCNSHSDCVSFFVWYNIIDKNTHISPKNIRTF
nr:MAG TPA: hypothetical protein [Caudoviricetes sp.]